MVQLRANRIQTSFYQPSETTENLDVSRDSRRNKIYNAKTRRWVHDTPRNRARVQSNIITPKIRNPRTGRMVVANPRNIRAAEQFREQRVRELMESRAAARITASSRRFIRQRSRISEFRFEETSENFQTWSQSVACSTQDGGSCAN